MLYLPRVTSSKNMTIPRADVINKFKSSIATLQWNKAIELVKYSQGTFNSQLQFFILAQHSYATLKLVYDR